MFERFSRFFGPKERKHREYGGNAGAFGEPGRTETEKTRPSDDPSQPRFQGAKLERMLERLALSPEDLQAPLQRQLYDTLLDSYIFLPVPEGHDIQQGISLTVYANEAGQSGTPVFTSEDAMAQWVTEPMEYVAVPFPDLCAFAIDARLDYLLMNLAGPGGGEISHFEMIYLADRIIPPTKEEQQTGVMLGEAREMRIAQAGELPDLLEERLGAIFRQHNQLVDKVYVFQTAFSKGPLQPALGVRMRDGTEAEWENTLWPILYTNFQEVLGDKEYVNVFLLNEYSDLESAVEDLAEPFVENRAG